MEHGERAEDGEGAERERRTHSDVEEAAEGSERVRRRSHVRRHQEEEAEKKGEGRCISHSAASCSSTRAIRAREAAESGTASSWGVSQDRCARGFKIRSLVQPGSTRHHAPGNPLPSLFVPGRRLLDYCEAEPLGGFHYGVP